MSKKTIHTQNFMETIKTVKHSNRIKSHEEGREEGRVQLPYKYDGQGNIFEVLSAEKSNDPSPPKPTCSKTFINQSFLVIILLREELTSKHRYI